MGEWKNYIIRKHNHCSILCVVILWTTLQHSVMINTIELPHGVSNETIGRTFGHLQPDEHSSHEDEVTKMREISYYDHGWTPKFISSHSGDPSLNTHWHGDNPNHKHYADLTEKEYDNYGGYTDEYYSTHEYPVPPPHHTIMIKPPLQTLTSKLSNLFSVDALKVLLILIMKLLLIKLKALTFMKFLILIIIKLPIVVAAFIMKLLFFVKLTNFLKIVTLPLFLPIILLVLGPIILFLPFLLLPFLVPLLLFLPIPILTFTTTTTTTTTTAASAGKRKKRYLDSSDLDTTPQSNRQLDDSSDRYSDLLYFKFMVESEQCMERIACKLAADKMSTTFKSHIARILDVTKEYLMNPRLHSYVSAYKIGTTSNTTFAKCGQYYPCSKFKT